MSTDNRNQRKIYLFISDEFNKFYRAVQQNDGSYSITSSSNPYPLEYNPKNLTESQFEFATNKKYMACVRTVSDVLEFIKDGAAILRNAYFLWKGTESNLYLTIVEWNPSVGYYELSYKGKFDFLQKSDDPKAGVFKIPTVDDSVWGVLSKNVSNTYSVECSSYNPKAIRVLIDGITLVNKITFQTVQAPIVDNQLENWKTIPFVIVNQDGDSAGIILKSQQLQSFIPDPFTPPDGPSNLPSFVSGFLETAYAINGVRIQGTLTFQWSSNISTSGGLVIMFDTSTGQRRDIFYSPNNGSLVVGQTYNINFDVTFDLAASEEIYLLVQMADNVANNFAFTPIVTNTFVSIKTTPQPAVCYGLRPLDLLNEIVSKATNGRFGIKSDFFTENNKTVLLSGDSLRSIPNAKIYTSFDDFFKSFDSIFYMALRIFQGELYIEQVKEVYKQTTNIIDLGDCIDFNSIPAVDMIPNEITVGSPNVDLRHPSGRLEFNVPNTWSIPFLNADTKIDAVSKYRFGCYEMIFLILDYLGGSTKDNEGDKSVYVADITDEIAYAVDNVETFENVTIDDAILEPIIKSPLNLDRITNNLPTVKGICPIGSTVNIYVDSVLDGTATVDPAGNFVYDIVTPLSSYDPGFSTGAHLIQATFTDLSAPTSDVNIIVDTTVTTDTIITYPAQGDSLYNNVPLIKGNSQAGVPVGAYIDGVLQGVISGDGSCRYAWYPNAPLSNGSHTITVGTYSIVINVDTNVEFPLITYIGSELDGFPVLTNLPLIRGSAIPGTVVELWLNYIPYAMLGTAVADANGSWQFQVVPVNYYDPLSSIPVILAPIRNGLSVISTSLINHTVGINVQGYKLNRPAYSSITGVTDNTVFNTRLSPKHMIENRYPLLASIFAQQLNQKLNFEKSEKNSQLVTVLNGVTTREDADINASSLGSPLFLLEIANVKTKTLNTFIKTLENFNNGGLIKANFRGTDLYMLPIGSMSIANITNEIQEWNLLMSPLTTYQSLLSLYKNGLNIKLMKGSIFHSDYNPLHFVTYDFQQSPKYNTKGLYDVWFEERNNFWLLNPQYIQKYNNGETIKDHIITNGVSNPRLQVYRCEDGKLIDELFYAPVNPTPIAGPEVVQEVIIDFSLYPDNQVFFVIACDSGTAGSGSLLVPFQEVTGTDIVSFTFSGVPFPTNIVRMTFLINGLYYIRDITILAGWTITDLIAAIKTMLELEPLLFVAVNFYTDSNGNDGLSVFTGTGTNPNIAVVVLGSIETFMSCISERIETKENHPLTILIEASNSLNMPGVFYSTGFKTYIRVEGIVKKIQPDLQTLIAAEENGDKNLIYSLYSKKREIRFGNAYGLPDYLYNKVCLALGLDSLSVENEFYTMIEGEQVEPSDDVSGHPLYFYGINLSLRDNSLGKVFAANSEGKREGVILVVDSEAVGLPRGSLVNIQLG